MSSSLWYITATAADRAETARQVGVWQIFVAVAAVVGFIAAVHQIASAVNRRRREPVEKKVYELAKDALEADEAKRDIEAYSELRTALRRQVEDNVPLEGRRAYLRSRVSSLRNQIATSVREYEQLEDELRKLDDIDLEPLDSRLRDAIDSSAVDTRPRKSWRIEAVVFVVASLTLTGVLGSAGLTRSVDGTFYSMSYSALSTADEMVESIVLVGSAMWLLSAFLISRLPDRHISRVQHHRAFVRAVIIAFCLFAALLVAGGLVSNYATGKIAGGGYVEDLRGAAERANLAAAIMIWFGTLGSGFCLAAITTRR